MTGLADGASRVFSSRASEEHAQSLAEASRAMFGQPTVLGPLQRMVEIAVQWVRGCGRASVSYVQGDAVVTPVWTDDDVLDADALQYSYGEGPLTRTLGALRKQTA